MAKGKYRHRSARSVVKTDHFQVRTRIGHTPGNLVIIARQRLTQRGHKRVLEVWGILEPAQRQELIAGLRRQFAGGLRNPGSYRRVLAHGDLRAKIRGTQRYGFGLVLAEHSGTEVAGHLTTDQLLKLIRHIALPKPKHATTREVRPNQ